MDIKKRLQDLNELHEAGLITEAEYNQRREKLLVDLGGDTTSAPYSPSKHTLVELMEGMEIGPDNHRFRLKREIGGGAMGRVWQAHDLAREELDGGTHYKALKVVAPELLNAKRALENLKREAMRASELNHPNIININGWQQGRDNWLFVEMEYLVGKDLDDLLSEEGEHGLSLERVTGLLKQMAKALDYAHKEHNIIHRDLKPGNVYFTQASRIKLLDFGLAYQLRQSRSSVANAAKTDSSGTPIYMPPEAFVAGKPDPRQDVYALACLTYELLTGQPPYSEDAARSRPASLYPPQPEAISEPAWEALKQGLAHDREKRPRSAGELYKCFIAAQQQKKSPEAPNHKEPVQEEECVQPSPATVRKTVDQPEVVTKQTHKRETAVPTQTTSDSFGWKTVLLAVMVFSGGFGYYQYDAQLAQERQQLKIEAERNQIQLKLLTEKAEAKRLAEQEATRKKAEIRRLAEQEAKRKKAETSRLVEQKAARKKAEAKQLAEQEAKRKKVEASRLVEQEAARKKAEAKQLAKHKKAKVKTPTKQQTERMNAAQKRLAIESEANRLYAQAKAEGCTYPDSPDNGAPSWICDAPVRGVEIGAVGSFRKTKVGLVFQKQMATDVAKYMLEERLLTYVEQLLTIYSGEMGRADNAKVDAVSLDVSKRISFATIYGVKTYKDRLNPETEALYVLIGLDKKAVALNVAKALKASYKNKRTLWQSFLADDALNGVEGVIEIIAD